MDIDNIKITHYLNKRLKATQRYGVLEYPVYIRVSYGRKNERVKSDWIVHPCSEFDFEDDKYILELNQYENEIIKYILKGHDDEYFNLSARLGHSQAYLTEIFLGYMFDKYEIKDQIIAFISEKTNISKSILNPYVKDELSSKEWKELYSKEIFNNNTKEKIVYLSMLLEFKEKNYPPLPDEVFGYRAGCIFVFHEWKNKNKKAEFLKFAEKKNILKKDRLIELTNIFEDNIQKHNTFDMRFETIRK
jgi:hypothetical protein